MEKLSNIKNITIKYLGNIGAVLIAINCCWWKNMYLGFLSIVLIVIADDLNSTKIYKEVDERVIKIKRIIYSIGAILIATMFLLKKEALAIFLVVLLYGIIILIGGYKGNYGKKRSKIYGVFYILLSLIFIFVYINKV